MNLNVMKDQCQLQSCIKNIDKEDYDKNSSSDGSGSSSSSSSSSILSFNNQSKNDVNAKNCTTTTTTTITKPTDLKSCNKTTKTKIENKVLTGVIVNGFHPQLSSWKKESNDTSSSLTSSSLLSLSSSPMRKFNTTNGTTSTSTSNYKRRRTVPPSSTPTPMDSTSLDEKIQEKVSRARYDTVQDMHDIQTVRETEREKMIEETSVTKMYSDMFENSKVPQLITAPGGRIAAYNKEFLKTCGTGDGHYKSLQSLTAFDIVAPESIPKLYEIFLSALTLNANNHGTTAAAAAVNAAGVAGSEQQEKVSQDNDNGNDEESKNNVTYSSLTVPCIKFTTSEQQYYITFSLMYDEDPEKRCFHCILKPNYKEPIGEIYTVSQKSLMEMLCQTNVP